MPSNGRPKAFDSPWWRLLEIAVWSETGDLTAVRGAFHRGAGAGTFKQIHRAWSLGEIKLWGSVDSAPIRELKPVETNFAPQVPSLRELLL